MDGSFGTSTVNRLNWVANGTSAAPITIAAAPGAHPMVTQMVVMTGSYLYLENLLIDKNHFPTDNRSNANPPQTNGAHGGNVGIWLNACNYCQVNGNESLNTTQSGVFISIMGNYIHDVGTTSPTFAFLNDKSAS